MIELHMMDIRIDKEKRKIRNGMRCNVDELVIVMVDANGVVW